MRNAQTNAQAHWRDVRGGHASAAGGDAAADDGEAEARAAGGALAGEAGAVEGIKDFLQCIGGHSGAVVAHRNLDGSGDGLRADFDGTGVAGVADGVAEDV